MDADEKTSEFLGLPLFKRLYGFGDALTLRAGMRTCLLGNVDRKALAAALPTHPMVRLHSLSPLILIQSDVHEAIDNGDPDRNIHSYREAMLAVLLSGPRGMPGPMFPLILFVDHPIAMAAGREFHGFPKVPADIENDGRHFRVSYVSFPRGVQTRETVMESRWTNDAAAATAALSIVRRIVAGTARAMGFDVAGADPIQLLSKTMMGEVWNIRQLPDLANPRRAVVSQLTRFRPEITDTEGLALLHDFSVNFRDDSMWSLSRFFSSGGPRPLIAYRWRATMTIRGGEVIDSW